MNVFGSTFHLISSRDLRNYIGYAIMDQCPYFKLVPLTCPSYFIIFSLANFDRVCLYYWFCGKYLFLSLSLSFPFSPSHMHIHGQTCTSKVIATELLLNLFTFQNSRFPAYDVIEWLIAIVYGGHYNIMRFPLVYEILMVNTPLYAHISSQYGGIL